MRVQYLALAFNPSFRPTFEEVKGGWLFKTEVFREMTKPTELIRTIARVEFFELHIMREEYFSLTFYLLFPATAPWFSSTLDNESKTTV